MTMPDQLGGGHFSNQPIVDAELRCIEVARAEQGHDHAAPGHLFQDDREFIAMRHLIEATAGQNKAGDPVAPQLTAIFQLEQRIALHVADHRHHRVRRLGVTCHGFGDLSVIGIEHVAGDQADQSWRADAERPRRDVGDVAELGGGRTDPIPHLRIDWPAIVAHHAAGSADGHPGGPCDIDEGGRATALAGRLHRLVIGLRDGHKCILLQLISG